MTLSLTLTTAPIPNQVSVAIDTESAVINAAVFRGWKTIQVTPSLPHPYPKPNSTLALALTQTPGYP